MGLKFFEFFRRNGKAATKEVTCGELEEAAIEYSARNLSFWVCVNMIANVNFGLSGAAKKFLTASTTCGTLSQM